MQKKWFVYIGDHHEGPFSVEEIQKKLGVGTITEESFVWTEGMNDWQQMSAVSPLQSLLAKPATAETTEEKVTASTMPSATAVPFEPKTAQAAATPSSKQKPEKALSRLNLPKMALITVVTLVTLIVLSLGTLSIMSRMASGGLHTRSPPIKTVFEVMKRVPFGITDGI